MLKYVVVTWVKNYWKQYFLVFWLPLRPWLKSKYWPRAKLFFILVCLPLSKPNTNLNDFSVFQLSTKSRSVRFEIWLSSLLVHALLFDSLDSMLFVFDFWIFSLILGLVQLVFPIKISIVQIMFQLRLT